MDNFTDCLGCGRTVAECECDDDLTCDECGCVNCRCEGDRVGCWNDDYDLDGCRVFDAHGYLTRRFSSTRAGRALHLALDQQAEPTRATIRAIGRTLSPVGTELGGHPWQRRANKRRKMQAARKCRTALVPW